MKKYNVIEVLCDKNVTIKDVYQRITENHKYNKRLFELFGLFDFGCDSKKLLNDFEELDIERFKYSFVIPANQYEKTTFSNYDDSWEFPNPNNPKDIDDNTFLHLIDFCQKLKGTNVTSLMLGIDEIEWGKEPVGKGTYGYKKAKTGINIGENYLSNSVLITKSYEKPNLILIISCENKYRNLDSVTAVTNAFGKVISEKELYAPSDEAERSEWITAENRVTERIGRYKEEVPALKLALPNMVQELKLVDSSGGIDRVLPYPNDKINIRKLEKGILTGDGWIAKSKDPRFRSTVTSKIIDGIEYKTWIDTLHGGHYLQLHLSCSSPMFDLDVHSIYDAHPADENQAENYLKNVKILRDAFVKTVSSV